MSRFRVVVHHRTGFGEGYTATLYEDGWPIKTKYPMFKWTAHLHAKWLWRRREHYGQGIQVIEVIE